MSRATALRIRSEGPPEPAADPWTSFMRRGDFERAWEISDRLLRSRAGEPCWHWPRHLQYVWNGEPLAGKRVLIRCYHGLGDTLQFIRYAPLVKAVAREVIVWAQPPLLGLLRRVEGIDRLLPLHDGTPEVDYDVDVEVMELPHVFRTRLPTIPQRCPYVSVEPAADVRSPEELAVGIVWSAGTWDPHRSVPMELCAELARISGVRLHAFQRGGPLDYWDERWGPISGSDDCEQTAERLRAMDLMISVDSFPAHLSGALGVPTWLLLRADPDWRWMERGDTSPWYPTMRLFRQEREGEWQPVMRRVKEELGRVRVIRPQALQAS